MPVTCCKPPTNLASTREGGLVISATEKRMSFAVAARGLPHLRGDRPVAPSTIWRWATVGLRGGKLETVQVGGTTCTSAEALERFFARLAGEPVVPPARQ